MSDILVELKNVAHCYDGEGDTTQAVDDINIEIKKGEFICVLGPSGCGKSTLLKLIAGFEKPSKGQVLMNNEPVKGPDWHRGVVFQTPALYPWLDVYGNVEYGLKMRKVDKTERSKLVDEYLELVGLTDFKHSKPYELSGGMKQRAALARTLVNHPDMILMDEPFGALDALTRQNMQELIRDVWKKTGSTIFLITHDVDEALILGTRVLVMSSRPGRIVKRLDVNFDELCDDENRRARYSGKYGMVREEILDIIKAQG